MKYLSPKNDLTFKKIFGEHAHLLKSFLNAMLPLGNREIVGLEYLQPELVPQLPIHKNTVVDVRCKDNTGRVFIVEMQMLWTDSFMRRVLFNASKAYVKQLNIGEDYKLLQPVYSLNLIDEVYDRKTDQYYHHYQIVNRENTEEQIEGLEFVFVELPKFKLTTIHEKKLHVLWLRFMTEVNEKAAKIPEELEQSTEIREAVRYLEESAFSQAELEAYERYWDQVSRERTLLGDSHRQGLAEGEQIGIVKGEQIGIVKGEQIGIVKGRIEGEWIGKIIALQEVLGLPTTMREVLAEKTMQELETLYHELKAKLISLR